MIGLVGDVIQGAVLGTVSCLWMGTVSSLPTWRVGWQNRSSGSHNRFTVLSAQPSAFSVQRGERAR